MVIAGILCLGAITGCASGPAVSSAASTSAIRVAEETGASGSANASYYLNLAKDELEYAEYLAARKDTEEAASMLVRAQVDAELALVLALRDADRKNAERAVQRFQQLQDDYKFLREGR